MSVSFPEVAEGVRAAIARYTHALDDGLTDEVVATYCRDGSCDIPGLGAHHGRDELRAAYAKVEPQVPQRHLVLNTLVTDWDDHQAIAVSDIVFLLRGGSRWDVLLVGRYRDTLHRGKDGVWRFHQRAASFVTE